MAEKAARPEPGESVSGSLNPRSSMCQSAELVPSVATVTVERLLLRDRRGATWGALHSVEIPALSPVWSFRRYGQRVICLPLYREGRDVWLEVDEGTIASLWLRRRPDFERITN